MGPLAILYLLFVFVAIPRAAARSARVLRGGDDAGDVVTERSSAPPPRAVLLSSLLSLTVLGLFTGAVARAHDLPLLDTDGVDARAWLLGVPALGVMLALRALIPRFQSQAEKDERPLRHLLPRDAGDWVLYVAVAGAAGLVEEAAYRGLAMELLVPWTGPWIAATLSSFAFAAAHVLQGRTSMVAVFLMAATMHVLVALTGTLLVAMAVHTLYDLVAGALHARREARADADDGASRG